MASLPGERSSAAHFSQDAPEALACAGDILVIEDGCDAPGAQEARLLGLVEASIFASPEPISLKRLARAVGEAEDRVAALVEQLTRSYEARASGLMIRPIAGGYQITTRPEHRQQLETIVAGFRPAPLSLPALETLAMIAYKQPITAGQIQDIRGVQGSGVLQTLLRRKLIAPARQGRPVFYKTTRRFLVEFGLKDLSELPSLEEFAQSHQFRMDPM